MKKITLYGLIVLFIAALTFTSCAGTKKCNGNRGIKTNMGLM